MMMNEPEKRDKIGSSPVRGKKTLREKLLAAVALPSDFFDGDRLEWRGRALFVCGCRRILLYSPGEIRLRLGRRVLIVRGEGLSCSSFSVGEGTVGVDGTIVSLTFEGGIA